MIIVEQAIFFISNFKIKCVSFFQKAKIVYLFCACVFCVFVVLQNNLIFQDCWKVKTYVLFLHFVHFDCFFMLQKLDAFC